MAEDRRMEIPRRAYVNKWTEIEKAIMAAKAAVEAGPADVRMTDATILLSAAFDSVADYVDGIERRRTFEIHEGLESQTECEAQREELERLKADRQLIADSRR